MEIDWGLKSYGKIVHFFRIYPAGIYFKDKNLNYPNIYTNKQINFNLQ